MLHVLQSLVAILQSQDVRASETFQEQVSVLL